MNTSVRSTPSTDRRRDLHLVHLVHEEEAVLHLVDGRLVVLDLVVDRVVHVAVDEALDRAVERGGEQHRLVRRGSMR